MKEQDVRMHVVDLTCSEGLPDLLDTIRPADIYHLAGRANVKNSWYGETETYMTNVIGAINLMSAIRESGLSCNTLIVSSGEVYGLVPEECQPITEKQGVAPRSPYAASKLCQEIACSQMARSMNGKVVVVRPFNHIGPGQRQGFVTADFAYQIARIEQNLQEPVIRVGNLDACRDFTDVRDTVNGYVNALQYGRSGDVLNVCSGKAWRVREFLDYFVSKSKVKVSVEIDKERFRPSDIPLLKGNHELLSGLSGWQPERSIYDTLDEILDKWRHEVSLAETIR